MRGSILISGMLAGVPGQGGAAWSILQYALGFRRLGYEVCVVEPVKALDAASIVYLETLAARFGISGALLQAGSRLTAGLEYREILRAARQADILINVSGMLAEPELLDPIPVRAYLDLDPAFNQLWHAVSGIDMRFAGHTHFFTVGQAIGTDGCPVPTCGRDWLGTLPPVVLEQWPDTGGSAGGAVTTIANWRGYGSIEHHGIHYGQKAHSIRKLIDLPTRTEQPLRLALAIHPDETADLDALAAHGWELSDPGRVAATPDQYRRFIQGSKAELGVAKSGYVVSRCGWFSDRSACYLASGVPVVAQDTGFTAFLPPGDGLLAFSNAEQAAAALHDVARDRPRHRRAARALAEEHLDSDRVLARLLERL